MNHSLKTPSEGIWQLRQSLRLNLYANQAPKNTATQVPLPSRAHSGGEWPRGDPKGSRNIDPCSCIPCRRTWRPSCCVGSARRERGPWSTSQRPRWLFSPPPLGWFSSRPEWSGWLGHERTPVQREQVTAMGPKLHASFAFTCVCVPGGAPSRQNSVWKLQS